MQSQRNTIVREFVQDPSPRSGRAGLFVSYQNSGPRPSPAQDDTLLAAAEAALRATIQDTGFIPDTNRIDRNNVQKAARL